MAGTAEEVRSFFESDAYVKRNVIVPIRGQLVADLLSDVHDSRILDLGCGDGRISRPLLDSGNRLTLVDFSPQMLARAQRTMPTDADIEYVEADILNYEPAEPFDVVLCVGVLAHVSSPVALIDRVARALRPGGRCIIQITDDGHPFGWLLNRYYRRRKRSTWTMNTMTRRAINSVLANHGFREASSRRYGLLLPGSGWLPERWRYRLEASAAASGFGGELLMCFQLVT